MSEGALWLVRHGHTVAHAVGTIAGRRDVALDGRGRDARRSGGWRLAGVNLSDFG